MKKPVIALLRDRVTSDILLLGLQTFAVPGRSNPFKRGWCSRNVTSSTPRVGEAAAYTIELRLKGRSGYRLMVY